MNIHEKINLRSRSLNRNKVKCPYDRQRNFEEAQASYNQLLNEECDYPSDYVSQEKREFYQRERAFKFYKSNPYYPKS